MTPTSDKHGNLDPRRGRAAAVVAECLLGGTMIAMGGCGYLPRAASRAASTRLRTWSFCRMLVM